MEDNRFRHIGDDQLVHGLPKHMHAVAADGKNTYWEIVPGKDACATCKSMRGMRFDHNPGPVHPHCTCEIIRVPSPERQPRVVALDRLQGYEDTAFENFGAGQKITLTFWNLGPVPAGVGMRIDQATLQSTGYLVPGLPRSFSFYKFGEIPLSWNVFLILQGPDGSTVQYEIRG